MTKKKKKPNYPILAVRVKPAEFEYIRREAEERGLTIARYVRAILIPFRLSDGKTNVLTNV